MNIRMNYCRDFRGVKYRNIFLRCTERTLNEKADRHWPKLVLNGKIRCIILVQPFALHCESRIELWECPKWTPNFHILHSCLHLVRIILFYSPSGWPFIKLCAMETWCWCIDKKRSDFGKYQYVLQRNRLLITNGALCVCFYIKCTGEK